MIVDFRCPAISRGAGLARGCEARDQPRRRWRPFGARLTARSTRIRVPAFKVVDLEVVRSGRGAFPRVSRSGGDAAAVVDQEFPGPVVLVGGEVDLPLQV